MKFTCEKNTLQDAVSVCLHAVAAKSSIAVLEGILVMAGDDTITLSGYNFKTGIRKSVPGTVHQCGTVVLNSKVFYDIVRKIPGDVLEVEVDDKMICTIRSGAAVFHLIASGAQEFPELPEVNRRRGISLPANALRSMIDDTVFAVSDNENKPIHTGSLFEVGEGTLSVVSVDGYRLAVRREPILNLSEGGFKFVVPGETLKELSRILPDSDEAVSIYPERKHALFEFAATTVTTRLLEGEFLDYRKANPNDQPIKITVDRMALTHSIELVSLIVSERLKNPVRCLFEGDAVKLSCITALGKSFDECPISFCQETVEIGFNNKYLLDALRAVREDKCVLELKSPLAPLLVKPVEGDKFVYLVLPVRLKQE